MIHLEKLQQKDIYHFTVDDKIDEHDVAKFHALLQEKALQSEQIKILASINDVPHFEDFQTIRAGVKTKYKVLQGKGKYAILTEWHKMEIVVPVSNFLSPGIMMRVFEPNEKDAAIAWLETEEGDNKKSQPVAKTRKRSSIPDTDIYIYSIDGELLEHQAASMYSFFKSLPKEKKMNLLMHVDNFDGFENLSAFIEAMRTDFAMLGHIQKYALLTEERWVKTLSTIGGAIIPGVTMQIFQHNQTSEAMAWLNRPE